MRFLAKYLSLLALLRASVESVLRSALYEKQSV